MNIELLEQWVEALKSKRYAIGRFNTKRREYFCVYGVLLDITNKGHWEEVKDYSDQCEGYTRHNYMLDGKLVDPYGIASDIDSLFGIEDTPESLYISELTTYCVRNSIRYNDAGERLDCIINHIESCTEKIRKLLPKDN